MPELPDITAYCEALEERVRGRRLAHVKLAHPFLLRSVEPPLSMVFGREVEAVRRLGKRIALGLDHDLWLIVHLMIAGRLHWYARERPAKPRAALAYFEFESGTLTLTEAGTTRRASLFVVAGAERLRAHDPGGIEVLSSTLAQFAKQLTSSNHTVKRALTNAKTFSGIGNAFSDEILHRAHLSPVALTQRLTPAEIDALYAATVAVLAEWTDRLRAQRAGEFPEKVTAFRPEMAVHGKFGQPCPVCGTAVQRIRYASNETNYCPRCQTGGTILADRALSRLLKDDWPRTIEELEKE
jgi:formamidopyrimidine-DNA glycosylase